MNFRSREAETSHELARGPVPTALAWIPAGAHLFELPNKINLLRDADLTVQGIYAGWAWFGIVDQVAVELFLLYVKLIQHSECRPCVTPSNTG